MSSRRDDGRHYYGCSFPRQTPRSPEASNLDIALPKKKPKITKQLTLIDRLRAPSLKRPKGSAPTKKKTNGERDEDGLRRTGSLPLQNVMKSAERPTAEQLQQQRYRQFGNMQQWSANYPQSSGPINSQPLPFSASTPATSFQSEHARISANQYISMVKRERTTETSSSQPDYPAFADHPEVDRRHLKRLWQLCLNEADSQLATEKYKKQRADYEDEIAKLKKKIEEVDEGLKKELEKQEHIIVERVKLIRKSRSTT